jgi:hypothetical protein
MLLATMWLACCGTLAHAQVAPPGFQRPLGKPKVSPLVGTWRGVTADGFRTRLTVEKADDGLSMDLVLTDSKDQPKQSGRAVRVRASGGFGDGVFTMDPAKPSPLIKFRIKLEGDKLKLTLIEGFDRREVVLSRPDAEGPALEPIAKAESGNPEFTEVASFRSGTKLMWHGAAALAPDGKLVAFAAPDIQHQIVVADVASGQQLRRLDMIGPVCTVRWSADGKTLVAGSGTESEFQQGPGRQVGLWDTSTWEQRALVEHHEHPISIMLSRDAAVMAVAGYMDTGLSGSLTIWDTAAKKQVYTEYKPGSKTNMALSPKGEQLVVSPFGGEAQIMLFDLPSMKQQPRWKITHPLDLIAMTPDGRGLAGAGRNGDVYLFNLGSKKQTKTFAGYPGRPHCLALVNDARHVALGGHKQGVHIVETRTGKPAYTLLAGQSVYHLAASADSSLLLTYADDRTVRIWKTPFAAAK